MVKFVNQPLKKWASQSEFYPGNLAQFSGTLFEVEFLQDMLPSLAIAVTLAADAMTDFWMEQFGLGRWRDAS